MSPMHARFEIPMVVHTQRGTLNDEYQVGAAYTPTATTIRGTIGSAAPGQTIQYGEVLHQVSHQVVCRGPAYPGAKPGDVLDPPSAPTLFLFVLGVEDAAQQGDWTTYFCESRTDLPS